MTPQWYTIASTHDDEHTTIPYHQMWEEARQWLPAVLSKYFINNDVSLSNTQQQSNINNKDHGKERYFIRRVEFGGGYNRETGQSMDCWHGMGKHRIDWVDELPESSVSV